MDDRVHRARVTTAAPAPSRRRLVTTALGCLLAGAPQVEGVGLYA